MKTKFEWSPTQVKALKASIAHWEDVCGSPDSGTAFSKIGRSTCACCRRYWNRGCHGCPIFTYTGFDSCKGTPFDDAYFDSALGDVGWRRTARRELAFLRRVLKAGGGA